MTTVHFIYSYKKDWDGGKMSSFYLALLWDGKILI